MYDVNYFIEKFDAIPEELWFIGNYVDFNNRDRHCALGHCGKYFGIWTDEANELVYLFNKLGGVVSFVNDGTHGCERFGNTPKERILSVLYSIRDKELSEANVKEANKLINEVQLKIEKIVSKKVK